MAAPTTLHILPSDLLDAQLSMVELITAMYPPTIPTPTLQETIDRARQWSTTTTTPPPPHSLTLTVTIPLGSDAAATRAVQMTITAPLAAPTRSPPAAPPLTYALRPPPWLTKAETAALAAAMPADDILAAFEHVRDNICTLAPRRASPSPADDDAAQPALVRVWFHLPSLSTRAKRRDLVAYAPRFGLTGFVLAGKPGVLCVEGGAARVDAYMRAIKSDSWRDVPSHQKKVSERFREACGPRGRRFAGMREITDELGARHGARRNRGDMAALEAFLVEHGVGDSFAKVIMGG